MICDMNARGKLTHRIPKERVKAVELAIWLLAHGISAVSTAEIADLIGVPTTQVPQRMLALRKRGEFVSPARGLWVPVPPEYRTWGAPPAFEMIRDLMQWRGLNYYVGWLSAAELLGASHHAPQIFQVAVAPACRNLVVGRSSFQFHHRSRVDKIPVVTINSRSGAVPVSCIEATLLDLCNDIDIAGGIDNVANIVIELCEAGNVSIETIAELSVHYPVPAVRRLGWLMATFTEVEELESLRNLARAQKDRFSILDPSSNNTEVFTDESWMLKINRKVEPDV